jgi:nitroreductase
MELTEAIYGRRATRAFTTEPVSKLLLEKLINAAIQAPSAVNGQPWYFTVIENQPLLDKISSESKKYMLKAMENKEFPEHLHEHLESPDFHTFYHAPALVVISSKAGNWAVEDATLAAQNLMLAAYGEGLGSCWIGFAQHWLGTPEGKRTIGLSGDYMPVAPIIVGHPDGTPQPVARNPARIQWIV